ncbi:hypothetical protein CEE37_13040 [candidate division LCP-89 bacterium B3_LCP]|uniref:Secretion system C-terminal sorting domain-containing protein n=1 Tax=candidate division LCP-89 bacterium B3_LCP TaxID=2012998 RepID=A0A532UUI2_UNCL8|nr:MAG: hypothetical protein CEE37_13040 [candidate division LCP-89 bacterium B3_LCP]
MDPAFIGVSGDFRLSENSPCIDAGDPALPNDPDNTINDQGAVYFLAPCVQCTTTPENPPIFIPATGGSFNFTIELENICDSLVVVDVWTDVTLPNGSPYGPIILRTGMSLPVGTLITRDLTQDVPAAAPSGYYTYRFAAGTYPSDVISDDTFNFGKVGNDGVSGPGGEWMLSGWEEDLVQTVAPSDYGLSSAYPNPFNPETKLTFTLPQAGEVSLSVYDLSGREVATLYDGYYPSGSHEAIFNAQGLTSGVYFIRLATGDFQQTRKLMLLK